MAIQKSRHRIDVDSDIGIGISIKMLKLSGTHFKLLLESKITSICTIYSKHQPRQQRIFLKLL